MLARTKTVLGGSGHLRFRASFLAPSLDGLLFLSLLFRILAFWYGWNGHDWRINLARICSIKHDTNMRGNVHR